MQYKQIVAALAVVTLAACSPAATVPSGEDNSSSSAASEAVSSATAMETSSAATVAPRIVDVTITDWSFSPTTITAKKGENVQMRLIGDKGIHSLLVADLGLNIRVEPGSSTVVTVPTDKAGTFAGRCGVPCGPGHRDMAFTIVVE